MIEDMPLMWLALGVIIGMIFFIIGIIIFCVLHWVIDQIKLFFSNLYEYYKDWSFRNNKKTQKELQETMKDFKLKIK